MNGHEKRSAFRRSHQLHTRDFLTDTSQPSTNSVTSSVASCETSAGHSSDRLSNAASFGPADKFLCPKAICECPETSESSSISSSARSSDKLSYSHDNGPTTDASTPDDRKPSLLPLAKRLENIGELRKSSDEEEFRDSAHLRRKKFGPRRLQFNKRRSAVLRTNIPKSPSYPSSMTSEYRTSSAETLSDREVAGKPHLRKILLKPLKLKSCRDPRSLEPPRRVSWNKTRRGKHGMGPRESPPPTPYFPAVIPEQHKLLINVSGRKFHVDERVLEQYPDTLLGNRERRMKFYDRVHDEIFLDRHRRTFDAILDFYEREGVLRRPDEVPLEIFLEELKFYSFDYDTLEDYLRWEDLLYRDKVKQLPKGKTRRLIWQLFEDSDSSWYAKAVVLISALVITLSVVVFCLETLPEFESLSHNVTESVLPGLYACEDILAANDKDYFMRSKVLPEPDNVNARVRDSIFKLYSFDDVFSDLAQTTEACQSSTKLDLLYRYMAARCRLQLYDIGDGVEAMLENCTVTLAALPTPSMSTDVTKHKLRHSQEVGGNKTKNVRTRTRTALSDTSDVTTPIPRMQAFEMLHQLCPLLDNVSQRSQYAWFVMEAKMGSAAGILFLIETGCIVWFLIELVARFVCSPNKKRFFTTFLNMIDLVAILPYFITLIVTTIETRTHLRPQTATILRTIRLIRMLRILKLSRYSRGFRILGLTLLRSTRVLFLLVCFQMVLAVLFSSIAYFVEYGEPGTQFRSIPESFWWALITMTTVGYGDVAPITVWGKITGACCAVLGILCISFPVPVIVSNFSYLYNQEKDSQKLRPDDLMWKSDNPDTEEENVEDHEKRAEENRLLEEPPTIVVERSGNNRGKLDSFRSFATTSLCHPKNNKHKKKNLEPIEPNTSCTIDKTDKHEETAFSSPKRRSVRHTVV